MNKYEDTFKLFQYFRQMKNLREASEQKVEIELFTVIQKTDGNEKWLENVIVDKIDVDEARLWIQYEIPMVAPAGEHPGVRNHYLYLRSSENIESDKLMLRSLVIKIYENEEIIDMFEFYNPMLIAKEVSVKTGKYRQEYEVLLKSNLVEE